MPIITLTTDFGTSDGYVASVKGVMLGLAPGTTIIDVTHDIPPQDIQHAAFVLWQTLPWFPAGTIHVAVVDPGVGTARRILAARCRDQVVLAPDNGLLSFVLDEWPPTEIHSVTSEQFLLPRQSDTFHGRDVFAPVAAHVANGLSISKLGAEIGSWQRLPVPLRAEQSDGELAGSVVHVDHYGNLVTNIRHDQLDEKSYRQMLIMVGNQTIRGIGRTFADAAPGELVAYCGSTGLLEVAVNGGSAARVLTRPRTLHVLARPQ